MVLDHVGIAGSDSGHEAGDQIGLRCRLGARGLQRLRAAIRQPHRDQEDPIAARIEPGGLEIKLQPPQVVEHHAAEVGAARRHQVLFLGW
jgi:hypothetical protein